jgi:hydrogenase maturation protein HypF
MTLPACIESQQRLPAGGPAVLACGADIKNRFAVTRDEIAYISRDMGNLADYDAYRKYVEAIQAVCRDLSVTPEQVAHDLHPDYQSTRYARTCSTSAHVPVQHHHAHVVACMVEQELAGPVIGLALDGLGMGDDGALWGGEVLVCDTATYRRRAHLKAYRMPGGDQATLNPERMAFSCLATELGLDDDRIGRLLGGLSPADRGVLARMVERGVRSPWTTSAGRLFDAVSALLGICSRIEFEAQAAIELQQAADPAVSAVYPLPLEGEVLDTGDMIRALAEDVLAGRPTGELAARFHNTLAAGMVGACETIRTEEGITNVVCGGGVFQNRFLRDRLLAGLKASGFQVYTSRRLGPTDAGIALGQAVVALAAR